MKKLRGWSRRKKVIVVLLIVLGLGLVVPWPIGYRVVGADYDCEPTEPPSCKVGQEVFLWRKPLILVYYKWVIIATSKWYY